MAVSGYQKALARAKKSVAEQEGQVFSDANAYRAALQKSVYGSAGDAFSSGLQGLNSQLAGMGPLFDSGARATLGSRLASDIYGRASGQVGQGYAAYLANALNARRQFQYQMALQKAALKAQQTGFGGVIGGIAGSAFGGPLGGMAGNWLGNQFGGGGRRTVGSDSLYYG